MCREKLLADVEKVQLSQLEEPQRRWDDLDTALAEAVDAVAAGPLLRELLLYQRKHSNLGRALAGRAALWHVYQRF